MGGRLVSHVTNLAMLGKLDLPRGSLAREALLHMAGMARDTDGPKHQAHTYTGGWVLLSKALGYPPNPDGTLTNAGHMAVKRAVRTLVEAKYLEPLEYARTGVRQNYRITLPDVL